MDLLRKALNEALTRNATETERWTKYRDEHRQAADNLDRFRKSLEVDILIPLGSRKALTPGKLIHTNEILISHSRNLFSNCTAYQAIRICEQRIESADRRLKELTVEREMYQNKLDLPGVENAFSAEGEQEIIEQYDEEADRKWRIEHRRNVREEKLRERAERERIAAERPANGKLDADVLEMLDELELMEELDYELQYMELENGDDDGEEKLRKLLSGELKLPAEKQRQAHKPKEDLKKPTVVKLPAAEIKPTIVNADSGRKSPAVEKMNPVVVEKSDSDDTSEDDDDLSDDNDDSDDSTEFRPPSAENLTNDELIRFYKAKVCEFEELMRCAKPVACLEDLELRTDRLFIVDRLQRRIDRLLRLPGNERSLSKAKVVAQSMGGKRAVSFGQDEIASFSKHQAPRRVSQDLRAAAAADSDDDCDPSAADDDNGNRPSTATTKSILKNRQAVAEEIHRISAKAPEAVKTALDNNSKHMVEFEQIMGDIFERINPANASQSSAPEPKRRMSKFKANRQK